MIFVIETPFGRGKDWAGSHPFLYFEPYNGLNGDFHLSPRRIFGLTFGRTRPARNCQSFHWLRAVPDRCPMRVPDAGGSPEKEVENADPKPASNSDLFHGI
jgi:hypothetical protein